jgi:hypothetical protein
MFLFLLLPCSSLILSQIFPLFIPECLLASPLTLFGIYPSIYLDPVTTAIWLISVHLIMLSILRQTVAYASSHQEWTDCYTQLGHSGRIASRREQCDVFDWRPSLLGNRSRNSYMDTLTTPVLLRYMVTNSRRASVSIVAGSVKEGKTIHKVSPRPSAFEVSLRQSAPEIGRQSVSGISLRQWVLEVKQCSSVSRIQEATSAVVVSVIVTICSCNRHSE